MKFHRINRCVIGVLSVVCALLCGAAPVMAIEPINDDLMIQVRTARDLTPKLDEPAIGPLLADAETWKAGDVSNARIPDYATLMANPGKYRGEVFLVEGLFSGVAKREQMTAPKVGLAGPWDGRAELWTIVVDEAKDQVVIVLLTDPPKQLPKGGTKVRLPARLYKVWSYKDLNKLDQAALVFVGKTLDVMAPPPMVKKPDTTVVVLSIAVFAGFCALIYFFRTMRKRYAGATEQEYRERLRQRVGGAEIAPEQPTAPAPRASDEPLPKDPVEALKELERRAGR